MKQITTEQLESFVAAIEPLARLANGYGPEADEKAHFGGNLHLPTIGDSRRAAAARQMALDILANDQQAALV